MRSENIWSNNQIWQWAFPFAFIKIPYSTQVKGKEKNLTNWNKKTSGAKKK